MEMPVTYTLALRLSAPALQRPARAVLSVDGDAVAGVEYRPEPSAGSPFAQAEQLGIGRLLDEAGRVCPSCGFAHAFALCQAVEALAGVSATPRAAWLRVAAAELERAGSHLATLAAISDTLGLAPLGAALGAQAEAARGARLKLTGERPGAWLLPGGLSRDVADDEREALARAAADALAALFPIADRSITRRSLLARTADVGVISAGAAAQFGLAGPIARAAGLPADLRRDVPYAAYAELQPDVAPQEGGDVYARILVLVLETLEALKLVERAARELPAGPCHGELPSRLPESSAAGAVEGPRGPVRYTVEADGRRIVAVRARTSPQLDRLLARTVLANATLDDVPLIVVSTDPCDACLAMHSR
jgi:Ni,Fe-hydrogenase III large subunit